jgi:hypothetical protein
VPLKDGRTVPVNVNKYRLAGKNDNTAARSAFLGELAKRGIDAALRIDTVEGITRVDPRVTAHEIGRTCYSRAGWRQAGTTLS